MKYKICPLLGISFLIFSCSKNEVVQDSINGIVQNPIDKEISNKSADITSISYSDEAVFKGIIFLEGPVAEKLVDFKDLNFRTFITDENKIIEVDI